MLFARMRMDREKLILGVRNINMDEGRSFIKRFVQDEIMTLRGGRKRLGFGYSPEDIEEASRELEEIEAEIFEELHGVRINYGEVMETLEKQIVCPVCQRERIEEHGPSMVKCRSKVRS